MTLPASRSTLALISLAAWLAAMGAGFYWLNAYAATPGPVAHVARRWPVTSVPHDPHRPTLVMVLHPHCACSRASVAELAKVVARATSLSPVVLVDVPAEMTVDADNPLVAAAAAIPGVSVRLDHGGVQSRRFGARVSGHVLLYDTSGELLFDGGITRARGHQGDNASEDLLLAALRTRQPAGPTRPAFGCLLAEGDPS